MTTVRYRPGPWTALAYLGPLRDGAIAAAADGAVLLLPPGTDDAVIARLWADLGDGDVRDSDDLLANPPGVHDGVLLQISATDVTPVIRGAADVTVADVSDGPTGRTVTVHTRPVLAGRGTGPRIEREPGPGPDWLPLRTGVVGVTSLQIHLPSPGSTEARGRGVLGAGGSSTLPRSGDITGSGSVPDFPVHERTAADEGGRR